MSKVPDNKLGTLYAGFFGEEFNAHDAIEDVKALSKVLFHSPLQITVQDIFEHGQTITAEDAIKDVQFLDKRHAIVQTYEHMLNQDGKNVLSEGMKIKFAENGISFGILKDISTRFVVALPTSVRSSAKLQARITRCRRIQANILQYFAEQRPSD